MGNNWLARTELLIGKSNVDILKNSHVLIVGVGGIGAYAAEQLCKAGIEELTIIDSDTIDETNINRQLIATKQTIGKVKVEVLKNRLLEINPDIKINSIQKYLIDKEINVLLENNYNYVIDAIDTLTPKINLIKKTIENKHRLISSMGSGAKINPELVQITDISKSYNDNLAQILRKRLHRIGIFSGFNVVFSSEEVIKEAIIETEGIVNKKSTTGTISYMPAIFGIFIASKVIRDLIA
jgi:tRNA A37 threonylcarbamoyladenosine dehydratase